MNIAKLISGRLRLARELYGHLHYFSRYTALASLSHCGFRIINAYASAAFHQNPPRNLAQALALLPRVALFALGEGVAATILGGFSLVVTAEPS
jgi:hypothetical protein